VERLERALAEGAGTGNGAPTGTVPPRTLEAPPTPTGGPPPTRAGTAVTTDPTRPPTHGSAADDTSGAQGAGAAAGAEAAGTESGPELARRTLGAVRRQGGAGRRTPPADGPTDEPSSGAAPGGVAPSEASGSGSSAPAAPAPRAEGSVAIATLPSRDELVQVWGDGLLAALPNRARARFRVGRFTDVDGSTAVFALPNETHRSYCEEVRLDVEKALAARFGTAVPIRLVVDDEPLDEPVTPRPARPSRSRPQDSGAVPPPDAAAVPTDGVARADVADAGDDAPDLLDPAVLAAETELAGAGLTPEERLKQAFPGAQEV
jgi:hypothetical protein